MAELMHSKHLGILFKIGNTSPRVKEHRYVCVVMLGGRASQTSQGSLGIGRGQGRRMRSRLPMKSQPLI